MSSEQTQAPIGYPELAPDKGLKAGALGLVSSIVVGMASTAPAYSPGGEPRFRRRDGER